MIYVDTDDECIRDIKSSNTNYLQIQKLRNWAGDIAHKLMVLASQTAFPNAKLPTVSLSWL